MDIVASSPIEFKHVNIFEMTKFLHVMYTEEQLKEHGVDKNIPDRQVEVDGKVRQRPTIAYLDSDVYTKTVNFLILQRLNDISIELGHPFKNNGYHLVHLYQVTRWNQVTTRVG